MAYLVIGLVLTSYLFISAECEKEYFSEQLGFESFLDVITNWKIIAAFIIMTIFWPIAVIKTLYSYFN